MWYARDVLYAVLNVCVSCLAVRGRAVPRTSMSAIVICLVLSMPYVSIVEGMSAVVNDMLPL